jgi:hypothetical protein
MSMNFSESQIVTAVPSVLRAALEERAEAGGVRLAELARAAFVRELSSTADPRKSRAYVEQYLAGVDVDGDER